MGFNQVKGVLVLKSLELRVSPMIQQKADNILIDHLLGLVHFHFRRTKIMQYRIPSGLFHNPIRIRPVANQILRNQKTYLLVLKTVILFHKPVEHSRQWIKIEGIGLIDLRLGQNQMPDDFVVGVLAGHNQGCLLVVCGFHVNIDVVVPQQKPQNLLQTCIKKENTVMCAVDQRCDSVVDVLQLLEVFSEVQIEFVDVQLAELVGRVRCELFDKLVLLKSKLEEYLIFVFGGGVLGVGGLVLA